MLGTGQHVEVFRAGLLRLLLPCADKADAAPTGKRVVALSEIKGQRAHQLAAAAKQHYPQSACQRGVLRPVQFEPVPQPVEVEEGRCRRAAGKERIPLTLKRTE